MNSFAQSPDSKEMKIRRLNGWLRWSLWAILFLVAVGTILGLLYWRRSARVDAAQKESRETAVGLIVKAIKISDSLDEARHKEVMVELHRLHPIQGRKPETPESLDTKKLYEQLQPEEKK